MAQAYTRRNVVRGAGGLVLGFAAAAVMPAGTRAGEAVSDAQSSEIPTFLTEPEIGDIAQTYDADVCVVGLGTAGVAAAREACELGLKVVAIEKGSGAQGRSGQFGTLGSKARTEHYGEDGLDACEVVGELMKESGYLADQRILNDWAKNGGDDLDWYLGACDDIAWLEHDTDPAPEDAAVNCKLMRNPLPEAWESNDDEYYKCFQVTIKVSPTHVPVLEANLRKAEETGNLTEILETRAVKLVREEGGTVTGVIGQAYGTGEFVQVNAGAVILATGDISGNPDVMHYYLPRFDKLVKIFGNVDPDGNTVNTADGQIMGMLAGAILEDEPFAPMTHQMGASKGMGSACFLELNRDGERFCNEDVPGQQLENQIEAQPGQYTYQFFDGAWADEVPLLKPEHGAACYVLSDDDVASGKVDATLTANDCYARQGAIDEGVEEGSILKADTLDELFELIGDDMDADAAKASIERYNELARAGRDEDFGKKGSRMFALETPPF